MPTLTITKSYDDNTILTEAMLDDIKNSIETFINTTKLDEDNIQVDSVIAALSTTNANDILTKTSAAHAMPTVAANKVLEQTDTNHSIPTASANKILTQTNGSHSMPTASANKVLTQADATGADALAATMTATGANAIVADVTAAASANNIFSKATSALTMTASAANKVLESIDSSVSLTQAQANAITNASTLGYNEADYDASGTLNTSLTATSAVTPSAGGIYIMMASVNVDNNGGTTRTVEYQIYNNSAGAAISQTYTITVRSTTSNQLSIMHVNGTAINASDVIQLRVRQTAGTDVTWSHSKLVIVRVDG